PTLDDFNSERSYTAWSAHSNTMAGNEALVTHLSSELDDINVFGLYPGLVQTRLLTETFQQGTLFFAIASMIVPLFATTVEEYVERTLVHVIVSPDLEERPRALIGPKRELLKPNPFFQDPANVERLLSEARKLVERALGVALPAQTS